MANTSNMTPEEVLLRYLQQPLQRPTLSSQNAAEYIISHANLQAPGLIKKAGGGPSILSRAIDLLSRPIYTVATAHKEFAQALDKEGKSIPTALKEAAGGAVSGFTGQKKTTGADILEQAGVKNRFAKYGLGFAYDVLFDPTTYVGVGLLRKAAQTPDTVAKIIGETPTPPPALVKAKTAPRLPSIAEQAIFGARARETAPFPRPLRGFPDLKPPRTRRPQPIDPDQLARLSFLSAEQMLKQPELPVSVARLSPKPKPAALSNDYTTQLSELSAKNARRNKFNAKVNRSHPDTVNPAQQVNIWNSLLAHANTILSTEKRIKNPNIPKWDTLRRQTALKMLIAVEDDLGRAGLVHRYWDGTEAKLSDIFAEVGRLDDDVVKGFRATRAGKESIVMQAIENVRGRSTLADAPKLAPVAEESAKDIAALRAAPISQARIDKLNSTFSKAAKERAQAAGMSAAGVDAATALSRTIFRSFEDPLKGKASVIDDILSKGRGSHAEPNAVTSRVLTEQLEGNPKKLGQIIGDGNKAEEWLLGRVATWFGQKTLRPIVQTHKGTALASANKRAMILSKLFHQYKPEDLREAFRVAQGHGSATSPIVEDAAIKLRQVMETLFSATGVTAHANTLATRSAILMSEMNKHLRRVKSPFFFTKRKGAKDVVGNKHDFSQGTDWLKSWQIWDVDDPVEFLWKITSAAENASREKALFDEVAERFGSPVAHGDLRYTINHPYLEGYHFNKDIGHQIQRVIKSLDEFYDPKSPIMRQFDKVLRAWKSGVTIYAPSHHIRNIIGDTYLSWLDGVNTIRPYHLAGSVLRTQRSRYNDMASMGSLVDIGALPRVLGKTPEASEVLFKNRAGVPVTAEQIYIGAFNHGLLQHAHAIEDILDAGDLIPKRLQPLRGKGQRAARGVAETREHYVRLAHFIDLLQKSNTTSLSTAMEKAAQRVRKWHPDGLDLTNFERTVLRRIMPFYSWTRKAIPLIVEGAVMNPGKTVAYPKAMYALGGMAGFDAEAPSEPFPLGQLYPDWIKQKGVGPLAGPDSFLAGLARNEPEGNIIVNPGNPFMDLVSQFSNPVYGAANLVNPMIKSPFEMLAGERIPSGVPIHYGGEESGLPEYLGEQLPIFSNMQRIGGYGLGGQTRRAQEEGPFNLEGFINFLTAAGLRGTGPYKDQARYEARRR